MRCRFSGLLTLLFLLTVCAWCRADQDAAVVNLGKEATALAEVADGKVSGTAFCIQASGLFVTNCHVVEEATDGKLSLVLRPGEKNQKVVAARVLRKDKDMDLALLVADAASVRPLELDDSDQLVETLPVMAFGYPFGRELALGDNEYPSVTVSMGHVTALRKHEGELEEIQLDAVLNHGNSGGPVLNAKGQVIGIVVAGIENSGINFAIPVNYLRSLLARVDVVLTPVSVSWERRSAETDFTIQVVSMNKVSPNWEATLSLSAGNGDHRVYTAKSQDGRTFHLRAPLVPEHMDNTLQIYLREPGNAMVCRVKDRSLALEGKPLRLSQIRHIQGGASATVTLTNGSKLTGHITGLETVETHIAGVAVTLDLGRATDVEIKDASPASDSMHYRIILREGNQVITDQPGTIAIEGASTASGASVPVIAGPEPSQPAPKQAPPEHLPVIAGPQPAQKPEPAVKPLPPIKIPNGTFDPHAYTIRIVNLETNDMVYDLVSRKIYATVAGHVPERGNSLTIIDPFTATIRESLFIGSEPDRMAISSDGQYIYIVLDGANAIKRFHIPTRTVDLQFALGAFGIDDMKVPPGHPHILVIAKTRPGLSPRHGGNALIVDGKERPG
ncbi:MAG TPA: trypsin-like peptidase domain-containing protein [Chthonomonadaceae bacterium]|nr:trypsin-like peptidase domain-containing protein [Chthonomonadaceae bacterium]